MKLYIRQKALSFVDRFYVMDEDGVEKYYVEGELQLFGKRLHMYDMQGNEVGMIEQKVWSLKPRFFVYTGAEEPIAEIVREFSLRPRYTVNGPGWDVVGNFMEHTYEVRDGERIIAVVEKEWLTWGDCYELDIAPGVDELTALAVLIGIDCAVAQASNSCS